MDNSKRTSRYLKRLKKVAKNNLTITNENISTKATDKPILYHKWLDAWLQERQKLNSIQSRLNKMYKVKYDYYRYDFPKTLTTKAEIETYINGDEEYDNILLEFNNQELIVDQIKGTMDTIQWLHQDIRNRIEWEKFKNGIL